MLIVSGFHDYYDTASAYGIDKTVVYNRKTSTIQDPKVSDGVPSAPYTEQMINERTVSKFVIGFCGIVYPVIQVHDLRSPSVTFLYSPDQCLEYLEANKLPSKRLPRRYYRSYFSSRQFSIQDKFNVENFYKNSGWMKLSPIFQEYKVPVFLFGIIHQRFRTDLVLNPKLQTYKFAKVKDPASAFQDIYMYISGVLGVDTKPMIEIDDKHKQAAKGHDGEYSFKKPPGGGRWR